MHLAEDFIGYMRMKLRDTTPILFEFKSSSFAPFWHDFITLVSSCLEAFVDKKLANIHSSLLYKFPALAVIPRSDYYLVYVKKPKNFDDLYLGYNTAYVSLLNKTHFYVVPYIKPPAISYLVRKNINPAVLNDVIYILPIISSIPCTKLKDDVRIIKDYLLIKSYTYLLSDDLAQNILGYLLLKFTKMKNTKYSEVFNKVIDFVKEALTVLEIKHSIKGKTINYYGVNIALKIIIIQ